MAVNVLMKLEFSRQTFKKYSNIKFHENPFGVTCSLRAKGRVKDRHDETNSRFQ